MADGQAHIARLHLVDEHGYSTTEADGYSEAGIDYVHWLDHEVLIDPHRPHPQVPARR